MPADEVVRSVTDGSVDVGLATLPIDDTNLHIHWIGEASCVAVLHEDHPLAQSDSLSLRQLHTQQVLTVEIPFGCDARSTQLFRHPGTARSPG